MALLAIRRTLFAAICAEKASIHIACHCPEAIESSFKNTGDAITAFSVKSVTQANNGKDY